LHYNYYRDYDPAIGRYVESDPIGLGGGTNTYAYVIDAPLGFLDMFGLDLTPAQQAALRAAALDGSSESAYVYGGATKPGADCSVLYQALPSGRHRHRTPLVTGLPKRSVQ